MKDAFQAGFIYLVGRPNVGKSTLFNRLTANNLAIISPKRQTTRQEIIGIKQSSDAQMIYVDTPGILAPKYLLQERMAQIFYKGLKSSDLLLWVVDSQDGGVDEELIQIFQSVKKPLFILLNKIDLLTPEQIKKQHHRYSQHFPLAKICSLSAHAALDVEQLTQELVKELPYHPPYYPSDTLTNKPDHFFAAELIRQQVFFLYHQEIPYHTFVQVESLEEDKKQIKIAAKLYVDKRGQQRVIIGHKGRAIQKLSERARNSLNVFFKKSIFLVIEVKVATNWRKDPKLLNQWGYH